MVLLDLAHRFCAVDEEHRIESIHHFNWMGCVTRNTMSYISTDELLVHIEVKHIEAKGKIPRSVLEFHSPLLSLD